MTRKAVVDWTGKLTGVFGDPSPDVRDPYKD
jgi:hypothetical protein